MNRTEIIDEILKELNSDHDSFLNLDVWCERKLNVLDDKLIISIVDELHHREIVESTNYEKTSVRLNNKGTQLIKKYGSYSSLLKSENVAKKKAHNRSITTKFIQIGTPIIFGISTAILGWLNYINSNTIEEISIENKTLINTIDSLKIEIKKTAHNKS